MPKAIIGISSIGSSIDITHTTATTANKSIVPMDAFITSSIVSPYTSKLADKVCNSLCRFAIAWSAMDSS